MQQMQPAAVSAAVPLQPQRAKSHARICLQSRDSFTSSVIHSPLPTPLQRRLTSLQPWRFDLRPSPSSWPGCQPLGCGQPPDQPSVPLPAVTGQPGASSRPNPTITRRLLPPHQLPIYRHRWCQPGEPQRRRRQILISRTSSRWQSGRWGMVTGYGSSATSWTA